MRMKLSLNTLFVALALCAGGCEEEPLVTGRGLALPGGGANAAVTTDTGEPVAAATVEPVTHRDDEFVEAEGNRDPFRSFAQAFVQREVVMPRTGIEEMRLIGIVSGVANPSAMLVDREGTGHTVHRGDYLGRPEVVQTGGDDAVPITLNWRVDRIRPEEVVLTREDPTAPNRPPLTRVMPLREESGQNAQPI
jgi:type IV pilus assembly protein PilP